MASDNDRQTNGIAQSAGEPALGEIEERQQPAHHHHQLHPKVVDEIRNQYQALRRRRSYDTDHLQHQHDSANSTHKPPVYRQFSHLNCHFQDEVFRACHLLQKDADDEEEKRGLLDASIVGAKTCYLHNDSTEKLDDDPSTGQNRHVSDSSSSTHNSSEQLFRLRMTNISEQEADYNYIQRIISPPPPSIASQQKEYVDFDDYHRQPPLAYVMSPIPPSNGCKPCWLLSVIYFWLFSPSRIAYFGRVAGITAGVLSAFFSSLNYAISEYLEGSFDPVEIFAWRQTLMIAFCFPVTAYYQKPMYFKASEARLWWPMAVRSVGSAFAVLFVYLAIEFIPLSDATVVSNAAPIFCSFIARIFLKEPFGIAEILCAVTVFCGVTLNAQPAWLFDFSLFTADLQKRLIGLSFALGGALATASTTVIMRTMKSVHFSTQQLMFGYISTLLTWPVAYFMGVARLPPCGPDKIIMLASGFTAVPAQALLIYACQNEKAGIVSLSRSTMPVFSLIFQITLFGILPDIYSILGNLIILGAILALAIKMLMEQKKKEPSSSRTEQEGRNLLMATRALYDAQKQHSHKP